MADSSDSSQHSSDPHAVIREVVEKYTEQLVDLRRDIHAHPELSWKEKRTTGIVADALSDAGLRVRVLPSSGLYADLGAGDGPVVGLRADLDALPIEDRTNDPWASGKGGVAHACGHDLHTVALIGAGLALAELSARGALPGRVRLLAQPAEEVMPGGAQHVIDHGGLDGLTSIFGLHCDPALDVGRVGLREGPLTGAADAIDIRVVGKGGHTSRPHLTQDLTFAIGKLITELPAILSRRMDPRAGVSLVWGVVNAGAAHNVIPSEGRLAGTVRMLDPVAWGEAERMIRSFAEQIVRPYGVAADVRYVRGVPPVVNESRATGVLADAVGTVLGPDGQVPTVQSLGGEDFAWYLERIPGAMARLGTRTPGGPTFDLHQGDLRVDDRAVAIGARLLAESALLALTDPKLVPERTQNPLPLG